MIANVLKHLANEVNQFVIRKMDSTLDTSITRRVNLGNIARLQDNGDDERTNEIKGGTVLSLVNIEEDRISKPPFNLSREDGKIQNRNPKIYLNLYCLFAAGHKDYGSALEQISLVIQFFQYNNVITPKTNPSGNPKLDPKVEKLVFDLVSLNFEQSNQLWGMLGGKYMPSVLYKMRLVTISEETPKAETEPILKIKSKDALIDN